MDRKVVGDRLVMLRGDKTQREVADSVGIAKSALCMYETGKRIPKDDIKVKLADYYGVPVQNIFFTH